MSDGYRPLSEAWRLNTPEERQRVGQRKLEELQEQIRNMESQMDERHELIHKLKKLQEIENDKKQIKGKILERQSRNSSQRMLLGEEMERLFGRDSARFLDPENPLDQKLVQDVIQHRTKEFSLKQQEAALQTQFLAKERERLLEARQRVQQKREALYSGLPLSGKQESHKKDYLDQIRNQGRHTVPADAPRNIESLIRETVHSLPDTVDRIWKMREDLDKHYQFYQKPYKGEMGIRSYEYWQIPDYFMVRSIVDELVEDFLNHYLQPDDGLGKETHSAMIAQEMEWMKRQSDAISERKAVQLVLEEMMLDETGKMIQDVVQEMSHMYGTFRNMADDIIMSTAEAVTTGNEKGRDPSDPTYNLVTKGYFSIQENRNRQRKDIWDHSQQLLNKLGKKKIKYKKVDEKGREVVVEEEEEDDEDIDAPDVTLLKFYTITPIENRTYQPSLLDAPKAAQDKKCNLAYRQKELEYWKNIVPEITRLNIASRCNGINVARPSPNHRYVAFGTFHGDIFVCDVWMVPWRPVKALANEARGDDPIDDLSWSLDSNRIITVCKSGSVQMWSMSGGSAITTDAKRLDLAQDKYGAAATQFLQLLDLDSQKGDFTFQQGPLAENSVSENSAIPKQVALFPRFSLLGTQNSLIVGMNNGDLLKCNLEYPNSNNHTPQEDGDKKSQQEDAARINKPSSAANGDSLDQTEVTTSIPDLALQTEAGTSGQTGNLSSDQNGTDLDQQGSRLSPQQGSRLSAQQGSRLSPQQGLRLSAQHGSRLSPQQKSGKRIPKTVRFVDKPEVRVLGNENIQMMKADASKINTIGMNIEAELMKAHRHSIVHIAFIDKLKVMVTIDQQGFIFQWQYEQRYLSTFGWYTPVRKYKLDMSKIMFRQTVDDIPNVVFTDKPNPAATKALTAQEIASQRNRVQRVIENMQLSIPWHVTELEGLTTQYFTPEGPVSETGALFHIITRYTDTKQLASYVTQLYRPVKVKCTRLVQVLSSPAATELIFLLLFRKYPPKDAHMTVLILDLKTMEFRDYRRDLPLSDDEFDLMQNKTIVSCDVSRVFGPTGADYLFIMFNGKLRVISLVTGQLVLKTGNRKNTAGFDGCLINEGDIDLPVDARVTTVCTKGKIFAVAYARGISRFYVLSLTDGNTDETRKIMWKLSKSCSIHREVAAELRVDTVSWDLDDVQHPAAAMRRLVLGHLDKELRQRELITDDPEFIKSIAASDNVENYRVLEKEVKKSGLMEKEGAEHLTGLPGNFKRETKENA